MRIIKALPSDLTQLLFVLGPRKLVLVEGQSDRAVFREWYRDRLGEVEFFAPEVPQGSSGVQTMLDTILAQSRSPNPREYGIIDRDFRSDAEVEAALQDSNAHLFILSRYSIENYLLEPSAVAEELRVLSGSHPATPNTAAMKAQLLTICRQLCPIMAANWVFMEEGGIRFFSEGHELKERTDIIQIAAERLGCTEVEAEQRIAAKEALINPLLLDLDRAYTRINGKHLLFHVHNIYIKTGCTRDFFCNHLARTIKEKVGLHEDIRQIIEQRILNSPAQ